MQTIHYQSYPFVKNARRLISLILLLSSCHLDNEHIRHHSWLHGSGYSIGAWLTFDDTNLWIRNDTIFKDNQAVGIITNTTQGIVGDNEFEFMSLQTGETGRYHEK